MIAHLHFILDMVDTNKRRSKSRRSKKIRARGIAKVKKKNVRKEVENLMDQSTPECEEIGEPSSELQNLEDSCNGDFTTSENNESEVEQCQFDCDCELEGNAIDYFPSSSSEMDTSIDSDSENIEFIHSNEFGRRVTDISEIEKYGNACANHTCDNPEIVFHKEIVKNGLSSTFHCLCVGCNKTVYKFQNSPQQYEDNAKNLQPLINVETVLGQLVSGGSYNKLVETLSHMGIPNMSNHTFINLRNEIDKVTWQLTEQQMKINGEKERAHAIANNQFYTNRKNEKIPWIGVEIDTGWGQISHHHHNMHAKAAETIIIGEHTGMPIDNLVRQKSCQVCDLAESKGEERPGNDKHPGGVCYRNEDSKISSKSMESSMTLQAFSRSIEKHGVVYLKVTRDGDTDIGAELRKLDYGRDIVYIPCCNHKTKTFRSAIEKIAKEKPRFESALGLNLGMRGGIAAGARCAMKNRSEQFQNTTEKTERKKLVEKLKYDIQNVFFPQIQ